MCFFDAFWLDISLVCGEVFLALRSRPLYPGPSCCTGSLFVCLLVRSSLKEWPLSGYKELSVCFGAFSLCLYLPFGPHSPLMPLNRWVFLSQ